MSRTILVFSLFVCIGAFMCSDLTCNGVKWIEGYDNFNNIADYFPRTIKQINEQNILEGQLELFEDGQRVNSGQIIVSTLVDLDFSEGDQYSNFIFETKDWVSFWKTSQKTLNGYYVDSFSWADGDHIRAKFSIVCQRSGSLID